MKQIINPEAELQGIILIKNNRQLLKAGSR